MRQHNILWEEMVSDPFADDDGVKSIVDNEGELFCAGEDEVWVLDVYEQEHRDIFGKMMLMKVIWYTVVLRFIALMFVRKAHKLAFDFTRCQKRVLVYCLNTFMLVYHWSKIYPA